MNIYTDSEQIFAANKTRASYLYPVLLLPVIGPLATLYLAWRCMRVIKRMRRRGGVL